MAFAVSVAEEARTRGFAAPAFAGCAFVGAREMPVYTLAGPRRQARVDDESLGAQPRSRELALREDPRPLIELKIYLAMVREIHPGAVDASSVLGRRYRARMRKESAMTESVYKVIELVGTSSESWEKATEAAVGRAAESLRDLRIAEVSELDVQIKEGKVEAYRAKVKVSFKYEGSD